MREVLEWLEWAESLADAFDNVQYGLKSTLKAGADLDIVAGVYIFHIDEYGDVKLEKRNCDILLGALLVSGRRLASIESEMDEAREIRTLLVQNRTLLMGLYDRHSVRLRNKQDSPWYYWTFEVYSQPGPFYENNSIEQLLRDLKRDMAEIDKSTADINSELSILDTARRAEESRYRELLRNARTHCGRGFVEQFVKRLGLKN